MTPRPQDEQEPHLPDQHRRSPAVIKSTAIGISSWAVISAMIVLPRSNRIGETLGGGWWSVVLVYGVFFIGGMAILPIFMSLDRIKSEGYKFAAQMLACLLIAIVVLIGIGIYTF